MDRVKFYSNEGIKLDCGTFVDAEGDELECKFIKAGSFFTAIVTFKRIASLTLFSVHVL